MLGPGFCYSLRAGLEVSAEVPLLLLRALRFQRPRFRRLREVKALLATLAIPTRPLRPLVLGHMRGETKVKVCRQIKTIPFLPDLKSLGPLQQEEIDKGPQDKARTPFSLQGFPYCPLPSAF